MLTVPQDYRLPEPLRLDCGRELKEVNVRYETAGTLNEAGTNAILIDHALTGDAHVCGKHTPEDKKLGWWDTMVGPGKGIDTDKYFVICSNVLGGCSGTTGPLSIDPATGKPYNRTFPIVTVADMVRAQKALIDHLGIKKLLAVVGGSMGGMQVLEWAVAYPDMMKCVIPIATTAGMSSRGIAFDWIGRKAIQSDPQWHDGNYRQADANPADGLAVARMIAHITYLSDESMAGKFNRKLQKTQAHTFNYAYSFALDFTVESYLEHQGQSFVERFDANSYCYITRATDYFDLTAHADGDLAKALEPVKADFLVVSFSSDWLFPPADSHELVRGLLRNRKKVSYSNIHSGYGHDAFLLEVETLGRLIRDFLANQMREVENV